VVDEPVVDEAASTPANTDVQTSEPANEPPEPTLAEQTTIERSSEAEVANAGWVIQLGSFRHQKNVRELLDKLENSGYRAFSRPVNTSAGRLTKVFVGPDLERDSLQDALPHLKELTGLSGKITQFKV
jgi:DedD protein